MRVECNLYEKYVILLLAYGHITHIGLTLPENAWKYLKMPENVYILYV